MKPKPCQTQHRCKIRLCDGTGDSTVATFDPAIEETIQVAQDELTKFMEDCIAKYGDRGVLPVWGRRLGEQNFSPFDPKNDDLRQVEEVVLHRPLVGG